MHPQTLRQYDRLGLVTPDRTAGRGRRYSARDIVVLREVQRLSQDEGVNLAGIKRILELELQVDALRHRVSRAGPPSSSVRCWPRSAPSESSPRACRRGRGRAPRTPSDARGPRDRLRSGRLASAALTPESQIVHFLRSRSPARPQTWPICGAATSPMRGGRVGLSASGGPGPPCPARCGVPAPGRTAAAPSTGPRPFSLSGSALDDRPAGRAAMPWSEISEHQTVRVTPAGDLGVPAAVEQRVHRQLVDRHDQVVGTVRVELVP